MSLPGSHENPVLAAAGQAGWDIEEATHGSQVQCFIPMLRLTEVKLPLHHSEADLVAAILKKLGIPAERLLRFVIHRRGYDARKRSAIFLIYSLDVAVEDEAGLLKRLRGDPRVSLTPDSAYRFVAQAPDNLKSRPLIIGSGPCGLLAGLVLAQMGFRPIILERGKVVRERTQDTWGLWRRGELNPESNVQFGEGGAGTFSDGKLYSQIKDPQHHGRKVLEEFVKAGAPEEILYVSKPHIGTFRLVTMVEHMRANIESLGGEIRFQCRVVDVDIEDGTEGRQIHAVILADGERIASDHVILAVGHSARDTFKMLFDHGVSIEPKAFSVGLRIEHPQALIDACRFGKFAGNPSLGAADYKLVYHAGNGRTAYSFCMCPGGTVVAATSEAGRVVTNGMSQYSRNERNANAAIVVGVNPEDFPGNIKANPLAGMDFQRQWEEAAFVAGGGDYRAPAQKVGDFLAGRPSTGQGMVIPSYTPGVRWTDLSPCLPDYAIATIREALPAFDKQIHGFAMDDAVLTGVETRTSSPIRLTRDANCQSLNTRGLYPAGEGAGYAGGILSAAVDGIKVAEAVALSMVAGTRFEQDAPREPRTAGAKMK